jgi:bifunctional non-homologous end joining protein LigD
MAERTTDAGSSAPLSVGGARRISRARTTRDRALETELTRIEQQGGDGTLRLADDVVLDVGNLDKLYFKAAGRSKGDVMRYYVRVGRVLLPLIADRPLILKRHPDGIDGKSFFQHEAPDDVPAGVRVERVPAADGRLGRRFVGGNLATLLYCVQLGAIAVNPWHSRVGSLDHPDYLIFDLDPGERAPFALVVDVALRVREALEGRGVTAAVKTSGASGLHLYVPLRPGVTSEQAHEWARGVAEEVSASAPREATVERALKARSAKSVYVDYVQNVTGKSVAAPFSVRARPGATVSMPLAWHELEGVGLDPTQFTIDTTDAELAARARVWRAAMRRKNRLD